MREEELTGQAKDQLFWNRFRIGDEVVLFATKSEGMFTSEYVFTLYDDRGVKHQFFADIEAWSVPFGVRGKILAVDPINPRALVALPNGEGAIRVSQGQLAEL